MFPSRLVQLIKYDKFVFCDCYRNITLYPGLSLSFEAAIANEDSSVTSHKNL